MLVTRKPGEPLSQEDLALVEEYFKVRLPSDFKEFISLQHEGYPEKKRFDFKDDRGPAVGAFARVVSFAPHAEHNVIQITKELDGFPTKTIPFGDSGYGDYVCLHFGGSDVPKVVLYRHEYNEDECLLNLADDFTSFAALLRA